MWIKEARQAYTDVKKEEALSLFSQARVAYPELANTIQFSMDQIKTQLGMKGFGLSRPAAIKDVPPRPKEFPAELELPPLEGVANDYSFIERSVSAYWKERSTPRYSERVSVVIPVYNRSRELDFVLAGLVHQTYPKHLIEVVIADDGSQEDLSQIYRKYEVHFSIRYCRQEDEGYRLAAARNLGIATATTDNIIILDSDAIPVPRLVESYMRVFHVHRGVAMFGLRHYVSMSGVAVDDVLKDAGFLKSIKKIRSENSVTTKPDADGLSVDWRLERINETNALKNEGLPYRFLVGANCGFTRELFDKAGGYSEDFKAWGFEDQEFGYRLVLQGAYFLPLLDAYVYHQEPLAGKNDTDRKLGEAVTRDIFVDKCPFVHRPRTKQTGPFSAPLVSIYVPLYNRERYIAECVQSALEQTVTDLEVVVCDDGSTDKSVEVINRYFRRDPRVRLVRQANSGIGAASNTAVRATRGCYIGQLDADDVLKRDGVERCLQAMQKNDRLSLVYGTTEYIDESSRTFEDGWNWPVFSREYLLTRMICHHFRLFRRRDWARTEGFSEKIKNAVDYDMMLKLAETGEVQHLNDIMYEYRKHPDATTVTANSAQTVNHFVVLNASLSRLGIEEYQVRPVNSDTNSRAVQFMRSEILNFSRP